MSHTALVEALYAEQRQKLAELDLERACYEIDLPLCAVLARMERAGFLVDGKALARFGEMLKGGIDQEEQIIYNPGGGSPSTSCPPSSWGTSSLTSWACPR